MTLKIDIGLTPGLMLLLERLTKVGDCHNHSDQEYLKSILKQTRVLEAKLEELKRMDQATQALLGQIDDTTNAIAANVATLANVTTEIGEDVDRLIAQTDDVELKSKLEAISSRLSSVATVGAEQVVTLQNIAAKSQPIVPDPPAPVEIPPVEPEPPTGSQG